MVLVDAMLALCYFVGNALEALLYLILMCIVAVARGVVLVMLYTKATCVVLYRMARP